VKKIWAIARNMIAQGLRMRIALIILVFAAVVVFVFPFTLQSEGTLAGKLQLFLTYSLTMLGFLLSILTIALSTSSLCGEIKHKQIFIVDSKPISRWQILLGKWLGILVLDLVLLVAMGAATVAMLGYLYRFSGHSGPERAVVRDEVLVARQGFMPPLPEIDKLVDSEYERLKAAGRLPEVRTPEAARAEIRRQIIILERSVESGRARRWKLTELPPSRGGAPLTLRFKFYSTETSRLREVRGRWLFGDPAAMRPWPVPISVVPEAFHEVRIPAAAVASDGSLTIEYQNVHPGTTVIFPHEDGMEVLVRTGGFLPNYVRGLLLIFFRLIFLAALGLCCATFLTFPVAPILALCVFLAASFTGFAGRIAEQEVIFAAHHHGPGPGPQPKLVDHAFRVVLVGLSKALPDFSRANPIPALNAGREIPLRQVGHGFAMLVLLYGGGALVAGGLIFNRRQLAALHG
jgi:hypothetical protein